MTAPAGIMLKRHTGRRMAEQYKRAIIAGKIARKPAQALLAKGNAFLAPQPAKEPTDGENR